jgi:tRNA threonylcarbamoyladenosine biosynthesis protein TsaB
MKIMAIEASGPVAGCAVLEDGLLIADYNVQYKKKHAQSLVPMMDEVKHMLDLDLSTVDAIAISKGPGSFTGLRIGAATAKGAAMDKSGSPVPLSHLLTAWGVTFSRSASWAWVRFSFFR